MIKGERGLFWKKIQDMSLLSVKSLLWLRSKICTTSAGKWLLCLCLQYGTKLKLIFFFLNKQWIKQNKFISYACKIVE